MNEFNKNFEFTKAERLGLFLLISIVLILSILRFSAYYWPPQRDDYSHILDTLSMVTIDTFEQSISYADPKIKQHRPVFDKSEKSKKSKKRVQSFYFDPNSLSRDSLILLGMKAYVADNIIKYRSRGGKIKDGNDFAKIYGLDKETLDRLKPYVKVKPAIKTTPIISTSIDQQNKKTTTEDRQARKQETPIQVMDLNTADTTSLKKIRGIGSYYAREIIKLRERYGGLYQIDQLMDLYKMDADKLKRLEPFMSIDRTKITKLKINSIDVETLARHPYFDWKISKIIINYRSHHGNFTDMEDLKKIPVIEDDLISKITPYLDFQS